MDGCSKMSMSASTIVANSASGYHIFRIDGYSRILTTATGERLESLPFTVGGYRWQIRYYPNGITSEDKNYISLYLDIMGNVIKPVKAEFKFRFIGNAVGHPLTWSGVHSFHNNSNRSGWAKFIKRADFEASKHLRDDSFAIRCDVILINHFPVEAVPNATAVARIISVPPSDLPQHLGSLLRTEMGADVVFNVAGETFTAHRWLLAARSPVFSAELFGAMKESGTGGVVYIEDMEPQVFKALLYLFPKSEIKTEGEEGHEDATDKGVFPIDILSQHLLVAADKYNLERLKLLCGSNLCKHINVGTVGTILALAEQHHCHELKNECLHFLSSSANLRAVVACDGFKHLSRSCPSVMEELVAMLNNLVS